MLMEYEQIIKIYLNLRDHINLIMRNYLTLIGGSLTVIVIISQITQYNLMSYIMAYFLFILSLIGFIALNAIIGARHDMVIYARSLNKIRSYFCEKHSQISAFLILPVESSYPHFYEAPPRYFFWLVVLVSFLNSSLFAFGCSLINITHFPEVGVDVAKVFPILTGALMLILQILWYKYISRKREKLFLKIFYKN